MTSMIEPSASEADKSTGGMESNEPNEKADAVEIWPSPRLLEMVGSDFWVALPQGQRDALSLLDDPANNKPTHESVLKALDVWARERLAGIAESKAHGKGVQWSVGAKWDETGSVVNVPLGFKQTLALLCSADAKSMAGSLAETGLASHVKKVFGLCSDLRRTIGVWSDHLALERTVEIFLKGGKPLAVKELLARHPIGPGEMQKLDLLRFGGSGGSFSVELRASVGAGEEIAKRVSFADLAVFLAADCRDCQTLQDAVSRAVLLAEKTLGGNVANLWRQVDAALSKKSGQARGGAEAPAQTQSGTVRRSVFISSIAKRSGGPNVWSLSVNDLSKPLDKKGLASVFSRVSDDVEKRSTLQRETEAAAAAMTALPPKLEGFYPVARAMGRRLVFVAGPTNSGKTHKAIEKLKAVQGFRAYLAPLRLLALEVRDRLHDEGVPTSLVTGELVEEAEGAKCVSATIEMLDFSRQLELCVIDEIQMLADPQRGGAWLAAALGAPAREVWLLGSPEARDAVEMLAKRLGEPLEVIEMERLAPFSVDAAGTPLGSIPPASAVIAFSRRDVLAISGELSSKGRRVSVVYGALSPEVRREQARRFREGESDVVVATDAIGMGLNLPIANLYFSASTKWDGEEDLPLDKALLWQIAGRAGRFGMHESGKVGALSTGVLNEIRKGLSSRPGMIGGILRYDANWPTVRELSIHLETASLAVILDFFARKLRFDGETAFMPMSDDERISLAMILDRSDTAAKGLKTPAPGLSLEEKHRFSRAPVPKDRGFFVGEFESMMRRKAAGNRSELVDFPHLGPSNQSGLDNLERSVKVLSLYCWLHNRDKGAFPDFDTAREWTAAHERSIQRFLGKGGGGKTCSSCSKPMAWNHRFGVCDKCHGGGSYGSYNGFEQKNGFRARGRGK